MNQIESNRVDWQESVNKLWRIWFKCEGQWMSHSQNKPVLVTWLKEARQFWKGKCFKKSCFNTELDLQCPTKKYFKKCTTDMSVSKNVIENFYLLARILFSTIWKLEPLLHSLYNKVILKCNKNCGKKNCVSTLTINIYWTRGQLILCNWSF